MMELVTTIISNVRVLLLANAGSKKAVDRIVRCASGSIGSGDMA
jgi:hypothetical protein